MSNNDKGNQVPQAIAIADSGLIEAEGRGKSLVANRDELCLPPFDPILPVVREDIV